MRDFLGAEAEDDATVVLQFAPKRARDVPLFVAGLPIFSRAYYSTQQFRRDDAGGAARLRPLQGRALRVRPLHRIRPREGLVGRRPAGRARAEQFRHHALRILSRPRCRLRGFTAKSYLFREEFTSRIWATRYDFPAIKDGRVKQAMLPDDTPSGAQGWFINTRREKFKNRDAARSADLRLRLRVDQQDHHVRRLQAHPLGVPEFQHDGGGQAGRGRACAARAVPRQGAGRGVRRAVRAAGVRRLGAGPRAAAQGVATAAAGRLRRSRTASASTRRASRSRSSS